MSVADYLSLLDWTARQVRSGKQRATPQHLAPIFDRLGVSSEVWCHLVKHFEKLFSIVAGQPNQIDGHRSKSNTHLYRARRAARELLSSIQACLGPVSCDFCCRDSRRRTCINHDRPLHAAHFFPCPSQCAGFGDVFLDRPLTSPETFRAPRMTRSGKPHGRLLKI